MRRSIPALGLLSLVLGACAADNETLPIQHEPYDGGAALPLACLPNLDGVIDARELTPTLEQYASFIVTPPLPATATQGSYVNTAGVVSQEGRRVWDWSTDDASHLVAKIRAEPLATQWYANSFVGAHFALPSDLSGSLVGIYSHDEQALRLHGVASVLENPPEGKTLLVYEQPINFFPFPLTLGKAWSQTGVVTNGTLRGLTPWSQEDLYEVSVDASGELRLPDFTFTQVLRVSTKVTIKPKAGSQQGYSQRQVSFLFECFGEVARATSLLFTEDAADPGKDFTDAREIRRLGWF
jgi:hypothetical protein